MVEYTDGTPASASQVAKDVVEFLMWTSNSEFDERKKMTIKVIIYINIYLLKYIQLSLI